MKKILAFLIAVMPFNRFRIFLWRVICKYNINYGSIIGWGNVIYAENVEIDGAKIGSFNRINVRKFKMMNGAMIRNFNSIKLINEFKMDKNSQIINKNSFVGYDVEENLDSDRCSFYLGETSLITIANSFDITDTVIVGRNVVFGGKGTQLWTHGFDICRHMIVKPVNIGNDIYIGSMSIICQGVSIADKTVVGAGTCVSSTIKESGFYVSNHLVRKSDIRIVD